MKNKRIVFLSNINFDYVRINSKKIYSPNFSEYFQNDFIKYVKSNFRNDILCLCGDYYDNIYQTINFVKKMETNKVLGFFVLGNQDYWNNKTLSHQEVIELILKETRDHYYFKLLVTGKKYYIDDLCFIGDTGWSSFKKTIAKGTSKETIQEMRNFKTFKNLKDLNEIKDFDFEEIKALHNTWIHFANSTLKTENKVIIVTHFPMIEFPFTNCWKSSKTELLEKIIIGYYTVTLPGGKITF